MSRFLAQLARSLTHHWKRGLVVAIVSVVALGAFAGASSPAPDDWEIPGTESQQAIDLFRAHTPALAGADATLVFTVEDGRVTDAQPKAAITKALGEVERLDGIAQVADPFAPGGAVSRDGSLAAVDVRYTTDPNSIEKADGEALEAAARTAESEGVGVAMRGTVVDMSQQQEFPIGELIGVGLAIILLTILFRSAAAMAATIFGALLGVATGQMLLAILAEPLGLPEFASTIAVMLGLGAGIDYALLILARFREQVAGGDSVRDASGKAAATAGSAVVAAGLIVMVAIAGLLAIGIPMIGKMGIAAAIAVAAVVVSALTFLPVMIGALQRWLTPKKPEHVLPSAFFERWGTRVTERPWLSIAAGVLVLLIFASPMMHLRLG
jgi:RND superfamily putative drug exporter